MYNAKNILEVPLDFPFIAYLLNSNNEKSAKCNLTFRWDNFFFHLLEILTSTYSKYIALLSEFSFQKKRKVPDGKFI